MSKDPIPAVELDDELRGLSCYTSTPERSLELFEAARTRGGVPHSDEFGGFEFLLNYADVRDAMSNHELFSSEPQALRPMLPRKPIPALDMDPPRHGPWRALFNLAVTPQTVALFEPHVRADVTAHIDRFIQRGTADLVEELADPVPAEGICHLVGIDDELVMTVRELAIAMFAAQGDPEEYLLREAEFAAVTVEEVHRRQLEPRDDLLSYLAEVEVEGRRLEDEDYVGLLSAFLGAGHHSTTSAMSSLIYFVFSSPEIRDELLADFSKIPAAVEEALRLRPPFFGFFRRTTRDTTIGDVELEAGTDVYMGWASANRDATVFPDPDTFRLDRRRNRHLTFGLGIHTCPGAAFARMELRVVLEELLRRIPDLTIEVEKPEYAFGGGDYSYVTRLPVSFSPRLPVGSVRE